MANIDIDELKQKRICINCIGEKFLKKIVTESGKRNKCSYCYSVKRSFSLEQITEKIETAFEDFFYRTSDEPNEWDYYLNKESGKMWEREGTPIIDAIEDAADIPKAAAEDVQQILEDKHADFENDKMYVESEYSSDSYYELKELDDKYWQQQWELFVDTLKQRSRIFNSMAKSILELMFSEIADLKTYHNKALIVDAGPGSTIEFLYRARTFLSDEALKIALKDPAKYLGPPPSNYASPGRMNSRGISVFYGANIPNVAINEVRPPVGSKVAVAKFEIIKPLKLLNLELLTAITNTGSIFDPKELTQRQKQRFLRRLKRMLTIPVMPGDEELGYIPTQAVADFLAESVNPKIDGIQFSSVQSGGEGLNIVLFHKSSSVQNIERSSETEISVRLKYEDEDVYVQYSIFEKNSPINETLESTKHEIINPLHKTVETSHEYSQEPTLKIDLDSIDIHEISAVSYKAEVHHVNRVFSNSNFEDKFIFDN